MNMTKINLEPRSLSHGHLEQRDQVPITTTSLRHGDD